MGETGDIAQACLKAAQLPDRRPRRISSASLLFAFGPQTAATADQVTAQPTTQAGAGYGAHSLRGLAEACVEVIDEAAAGG